MIKVFQSMTIENDGQSNCFNACIASILELPLRNVPRIHLLDDGYWVNRWQVWLADKDLKTVFCEPHNPPKGYSLVTVHTERLYPDGHKHAGRHVSHVCVAFDGKIVHDPYPTGSVDYHIRYYQKLCELTNVEKDLHRINLEQGRCIHGYRYGCNTCPALDHN